MTTDYQERPLGDEQLPSEGEAICPACGEDLEWHICGAKPSDKTLRIRELNDALRTSTDHIGVLLAKQLLVITHGVAAHGNAFIDRAIQAVRSYRNFGPDNDPYGEHDFGQFTLDDETLFWKIDYYDNELENGSPDPSDPAVTRRALTVLLAEEY
jgi:Protein of unknown function (DUF3768)